MVTLRYLLQFARIPAILPSEPAEYRGGAQ